MRTQPAYDAIALEYGGHAVDLRPSLRAALYLERLHGGFPQLLKKIEEFDTLTVWHVITASAGKTAANDLFAYAAVKPLSGFVDAAQPALFDLVASLLPETQNATDTDTGKPVAWSDAFRELFKIATGWLGWTPETAWNATPQEITDAFDAHVTKLKAIYGAAEDDTDSELSYEQKAQNEALGLDPEFDRAGLQALKGMSHAREGQAA